MSEGEAEQGSNLDSLLHGEVLLHSEIDLDIALQLTPARSWAHQAACMAQTAGSLSPTPDQGMMKKSMLDCLAHS